MGGRVSSQIVYAYSSLFRGSYTSTSFKIVVLFCLFFFGGGGEGGNFSSFFLLVICV